MRWPSVTPRKQISDLTRWEALDLCMAITDAINANRIGTVVMLSGLSDELAEGLTIEEIMQCVNIRLISIAQRAGLEMGQP